ncbi:hypothetical protein [Coprococcus comes]|uniref:DUF4355 domain-containing protein n=1 Tax=Coprococcus comes TaxID=410072 RepID=A0A3R6GM83_9FIRM|nr:hypothetical protein [Coprococcus comes]RHF85335.1 hypothetical protein DW656_02925 [Coprococcus comes]
MSEQNATTGVSQQEPAQQTATQGEKMFTQDDVNRIVKERLARAKTVQEPDTRELELEKRENALYLREQVTANGLSEDLLEEMKGMDKATIDKCLKILAPYAKKASEPILNAVGPTAGGAQSESDAIRKAMGLK